MGEVNIKKDTSARGKRTYVAYDKRTGTVVARGSKEHVSSFAQRNNNWHRTGLQRPDAPENARAEDLGI